MLRRWVTNIIRIIFLLILAFAIFWLVYGKQWYDDSINKVKPVAEHAPIALSSWIVDWDWDSSTQNMQSIAQNWDSIQLFLGYFNTNNELIWNEKQASLISDARQKLAEDNNVANQRISKDNSNDGQISEQDNSEIQQESAMNSSIAQQGSYNDNVETPLYLTLVNDRVLEDGSSIQKDESIVTAIIQSPESQYQYIEHFMSIIHENKLDGLEMDFENISAEHWPKLLEFYELLHRRLAAEDVLLRILLEPKVQFEHMELPEGPQYVVMAYNLFGYHSGPGPKTNRAMIQKLAARMEHIPGEPTVAIATGGFDWSEDGTIAAVSEQTALDLLEKAIDGHITRDEESGAIHFDYLDEHNVKHTVWTSDEETIQQWIEMIRQRGYSNISIWRMGQVSEQTLLYLEGVK